MERVIIACVDRSPEGRSAAAWAEREAALRGLPLRTTDMPPPGAAGVAERPADPADRAVAGPAARDTSLPVDPWAAGGQAELIVLGPARGLPPPATVPIVVVPGTPPRSVDAVIVGVDARDPAGGALRFAFEAARLHGVRLHAVHAWALPSDAADRSPLPVLEEDRATWEDQEVQALSDALRPWRGKYQDVDVLEDVVLFAPAAALVHAGGDSALVVVGRRSGRTALAVLEEARCPVAVVPS